MTGILKEIESRRAYRAIDPEKKVSKDILKRLMTAATYAPSCFNSQPWRFMVINGDEKIKRLHDALSGGNYWAKQAPVIIVVVTKPELDARLSDDREYTLYGCGLAAGNLLIQAVKELLYAHPMAGYDPLAVKNAFGISPDYSVINLIAVGYPGAIDGLSEKHQNAQKSEKNRKPENEVICYNDWTLE